MPSASSCRSRARASCRRPSVATSPSASRTSVCRARTCRRASPLRSRPSGWTCPRTPRPTRCRVGSSSDWRSRVRWRCEPTLLLLDEPTAMLDPVSAASVRASVTEVADAQQLTTVVVEHKLGPWLDFADRLVVLDDTGAVTADGDPREVLATHGDSLAAQGIWVPASRPRTPRGIPAGTFAPSPIGANVVALAAEDVTVTRSVRRLDGSTRTTTAVQRPVGGTRGPGRSTPWSARAAPASRRMLLAMAGLLDHSGSVAVHPDLVPGSARGRRAASATPPSWGTTDLARVLAWVPAVGQLDPRGAHRPRRGDDDRARPRAGRGPRRWPGPAPCSTSWDWPTSNRSTPATCPVANSAGWPWCPPSSTNPRCCSPTRRRSARTGSPGRRSSG